MSDHFTEVFNNDANIDWTILDDLRDKTMNISLNESLNFIEFKNEIKKLILHKAPGRDGVSPNVLRALDGDNIMELFKICGKYFEGNYDMKEW